MYGSVHSSDARDEDVTKKKELLEASSTLNFSRVHASVLYVVLSFGYVLLTMRRYSISTWTNMLVKDYHTDAAGLATLSSGYLYAFAATQIPIGIILNFGKWPLLIVSCSLVCVGTMVFATSTNLTVAIIARVVVGIGDGPFFLTIIDLCSKKFPRTAATLLGITVALAVAGGFLAQAPNAILSERIGWRNVERMYSSAQILILITLIVLWIAERCHNNKQLGDLPERDDLMPELSGSSHDIKVRPTSSGSINITSDSSQHGTNKTSDSSQHGTSDSSQHATCCGTVREIISNRDNWVLFTAATVFELTTFSFQMLWDIPYLETLYGMSTSEASGVNSVMLISWGITNPLWGILFDRAGKWAHNDRAVMGTAVGIGLIAACVMFFSNFLSQSLLPVPLIVFLLFCMGQACPLSVFMATANKRNSARVGSLVTAICNTILVGCGGLSQVLYAKLLLDFDSGAGTTTANTTGSVSNHSDSGPDLHYDTNAYHKASCMYPVAFFLSFTILVLGLSCKKSEDDEEREPLKD